MLQTLQLEQKTASQLEAFQIQYGLNTSEAIEKLLTIAKTEAAFDRLMGKESMPDDEANLLAVMAVQNYRRG